MLSEDLQKALDAAFVSARMEGHELLTVEHLLLALLSDTQVSEALSAAGADADKLEEGLKEYIRTHIQSAKDVEKHEVQPTLSFQRVLQRAIYHVQAAGKKNVTTLNVLVAIFSEKDTHAVYLLGEQPKTTPPPRSRRSPKSARRRATRRRPTRARWSSTPSTSTSAPHRALWIR
jgi:ATP-dependent Clp protease ATP-binding subunit ClpA